MADRKISELASIPAVASADVLAIVDTSLSETNKVSVEDLLRSAPSGTAAAPSIAFVDDPDTGIFKSGTNELAISTGGTQRVVVNSSGVGIGTTAPTYKFDCRGEGAFELFNTSGGGNVLNFRPSLEDANKFNMSISSYDHSGGGVGNADGLSINSFDGLSVCTGSSTTRNEKLRITEAGKVGVGTTSVAGTNTQLEVAGGTATEIKISSASANNANFRGLRFGITGDSNDYSGVLFKPNTAELRLEAGYSGFGGFQTLYTNGSERVRLDSSGRLLCGTSSARTMSTTIVPSLQAEGTSNNTSALALVQNNSSATIGASVTLAKTRATTKGGTTVVQSGENLGSIYFEGADGTNLVSAARIFAAVDGTPGANDMPGRLVFSTTADGGTIPTERMRISNDGTITFNFAGGLYEAATFSHTATYGNGTLQIQPVTIPGSGTANFYTHFADKTVGGTTKHNVVIGGSLSKGSGSFRVPHPLKPDTHELVHSFIEGPQADNIYRGKVDLVDGAASVNIDAVAGMTEGTFAALNREVQCFTTNETGWTAIRGSVEGNILTIEAQDPECADTISWLVIGERQDQHMYDTDWTDDNGKVIVEPLA